MSNRKSPSIITAKRLFVIMLYVIRVFFFRFYISDDDNPFSGSLFLVNAPYIAEPDFNSTDHSITSDAHASQIREIPVLDSGQHTNRSGLQTGVLVEPEDSTECVNYLLEPLPKRDLLPDHKLKSLLVPHIGDQFVLVYRNSPYGDRAVLHFNDPKRALSLISNT